MKGDIYVRFFLFMSGPARTTVKAPAALYFELGHNGRYPNCFQGPHIFPMAPIRIRKPSRIGAEIVNAFKREMRLGGEHLAQLPKIGPLKMLRASIFNGVVQIETIYVRDDSNCTPQK